MVKAKKNFLFNLSDTNPYDTDRPSPIAPNIFFHETYDQLIYPLFKTSKDSVFGLKFARNCPFQPSHPDLKPSSPRDYSVPDTSNPKLAKQIRQEVQTPTTFLIGQTYEPFAPFAQTRLNALQVGKALACQGFKIWFKTRVFFDLEIFESLLYFEEKVQLLIPLNTLNERISQILEPFSPSPIARIQQLETLKNLGIPFEPCIDSLIPGLNDTKANLMPLLQRLVEKNVSRATISYLHYPQNLAFNLSKKISSLQPCWNSGLDRTISGFGPRRLIELNYRKSKYAEIMAWGKQVGINLLVDEISNPDMSRKPQSFCHNSTSNLKERYLSLSHR